MKIIEHEPALIRIGKNGLNDNILDEIKHLIQLKKAVKVKILSNSPYENSDELFKNIERETGFKIWSVKGKVAVFYFKKIE